jgi:hypothetical protein
MVAFVAPAERPGHGQKYSFNFNGLAEVKLLQVALWVASWTYETSGRDVSWHLYTAAFENKAVPF